MSAVFVFGTSNSVIQPGYMEYLRPLLAEQGIELHNHSVGNATSVMGLMRLFQAIGKIGAGDVVVWEYPILDAILDRLYDGADIIAAYRLAWRAIAQKQANIVVALINPRQDILDGADRPMVRTIASDAREMSLGWVAMRDVMIAEGVTDPAAQAAPYGGENGHLTGGASMLPDFAAAIRDAVLGRLGTAFAGPVAPWTLPDWRWCGGTELAGSQEDEILPFKNNLMDLLALNMRPDNRFYALPVPARRIIALGLVTTHRSGAVWCGHNGCAPASARLPVADGHPFLLQMSRLPCVRPAVTTIAAAPAWAMQRSLWADVTLARLADDGDAAPVAIFGALIEPV